MSAQDEILLADTAEDLIAEFGRTVNLVPPGTTDASATEPWKGKTAKGTPVPIKCVFQPMNKELVAGTAVQVGDALAILSSKALSRALSQADVLVDGTRQWQIVAVIEAKPGATSFVWFAQVREAGA